VVFQSLSLFMPIALSPPKACLVFVIYIVDDVLFDLSICACALTIVMPAACINVVLIS